MAADALYDLLVALFRSEAELRRFLALVGLEDVEHRLVTTKGGSLRTVAADASALLQDRGLVNERFFAELARRVPERADDVWDVALAFGVETAESVGAA